jgi:hypothetical protein
LILSLRELHSVEYNRTTVNEWFYVSTITAYANDSLKNRKQLFIQFLWGKIIIILFFTCSLLSNNLNQLIVMKRKFNVGEKKCCWKFNKENCSSQEEVIEIMKGGNYFLKLFPLCYLFSGFCCAGIRVTIVY